MAKATPKQADSALAQKAIPKRENRRPAAVPWHLLPGARPAQKGLPLFSSACAGPHEVVEKLGPAVFNRRLRVDVELDPNLRLLVPGNIDEDGRSIDIIGRFQQLAVDVEE